MRVTYFFAAVVLAVLGSGGGSAAARESYLLHVQSHQRSGGRAVDIQVPWNARKAGTPFQFTKDSCDDVSLERLRAAWTALMAAPEGRRVTIETRSESIKAWRHRGYLMLEPRDRGRADAHPSRIAIPGYIVNTILDHDGRLTPAEVARLARERGKVTLVAVDSEEGGVTVWIDRDREAVD